ncbi:FAD-dependent oxidoreductase [Geobacter sp. SVR]|uniref:FAD-dependent oxidoreductase n=1 Tax=Geobacter sp. SVR TaxID=2495594 RepID=UPI00143F0026|nr:FAD-dependent oxidoreductase [Geobacter sp. SVR]BCS54346.1 pyridine nucleotide-disulfide oxidoreductase [Geobacter sp. SVR]GCF87485.1 pyridine nucleotide-disulfide oxidoreductase [Geobacter sp. SVR]
MKKKIVIVGGVAGGASTAARLRRLDESLEIVILERGDAISYANCGLPYYIGGIISDRDALFLQTPEAMKKRFNIDVKVRSEVVRIDRDKKEVVVRDLEQGNTYTVAYDKLVLSPGSSPIVPNVPGSRLPNVFTLRTVPDTDRIKGYLTEQEVHSAVVVGGGFIGIEMAENLAEAGKKVTIVEMSDQVLNNLDYEMATLVHQELRGRGINLILGNGLAAIHENGKNLEILLNDGTKIVAEMVVLAIGVRPETTLAVDAGLSLGSSGAIRVDERLQTSDPDIYAVGDAVEIREIVSGTPGWVPLAGPANRQGRLLADILAGRDAVYRGAQGTSIVKVFDLHAGSTGLSEKALKKRGIDYAVSITHSNSHASYYPGASTLTIKLLFAPDTGRLLGAQAAGHEGVDKRLDVLATAIRFEKTVFDLTDLELAYAPPFSSAKDPVNIAGYTATNIINDDMAVITWDQLREQEASARFLLDIREPVEFQLGAIPGAVNIPLNELRGRLQELPRDRQIVVYCQVGLRAYLASRILLQNGFRSVKNLSGGYRVFQTVLKEQELRSQAPADKGVVAAAPKNEAGEGIPTAEMVKVNACGLQCPGPILQLHNSMQQLNDGEVLEITASDPGFANDVQAWCSKTGNTLLALEREPGRIMARIRCGVPATAVPVERGPHRAGTSKTIVVFSGDLDKAIASFIIATGAAAMGRKVTMFFTFWGLNVLRRPERVTVSKGLMDRMFGMMMPRGAAKLGLSRMNMAGIGPRMIRMIMGQKNVASLESMIAQARTMGIELVACQMSMDLMGIKQEELVEGVESGGVASYLAAAEEGNTNLFI